MTAVMKYAGSLSFDDLDAKIRQRMRDSKAAESDPAAGASAMPAAGRFEAAYGALLRFAAINLAGFALVGAAWTRGWLATVVDADRTGLTLTIVAVFVCGLAFCGIRLRHVCREAVAAGQPTPSAGSWAADYLSAIAGRDSGARAIVASALQLRLSDWISPVRHVANSLVLLGLIGTVIGFIISLSGVDANAVSDVKAISPMVSTLLGGMSVALYTTLAGAALNLWLMVNHRLLAGATVRLVAGLVERGEAHECS